MSGPEVQNIRVQVEVSSMLYRDELEEGGLMEKDDLDAAVAERRAELMAEAERELGKLAGTGRSGNGADSSSHRSDGDRSSR